MKDKIKTWFYELWHGHPRLIDEEADIICKTRAEEKWKWMDEGLIQILIKMRIKAMYQKKFPK